MQKELRNYECENQMTFDECLVEMKSYNEEKSQSFDSSDNKTGKIDILSYIPEGFENAISRKKLCALTGLNDRVVRNLIEEARRETIIISNNDGSGYWTFPDNPTDKEQNLLNKYVKQQESRAKSIFYALRPARLRTKGGGNNGR